MPEIEQLQAYARTLGGYDLHGHDLGLLSIEGWEGFPVRKFQYTKTDRSGVRKSGLVALLDPDPHQIATWAFNAVIAVKGNYDVACGKAIVKQASMQSGFQFPVRGIHWENQNDPDVFQGYTFFNGVTVRLRGLNPSWTLEPLSDKALEQVINTTLADVSETKKWARIVGTGRADYIANGGTMPTDGNQWLEVVRTLYQAAWNTDHNELIEAWARTHL